MAPPKKILKFISRKCSKISLFENRSPLLMLSININGGSANVWLGDTPICTTNCKEALELIVKTLADKFDAKLPARSEMIYDTVMGW